MPPHFLFHLSYFLTSQKRLFLIVVLLGSFVFIGLSLTNTASADKSHYKEGEVIVKYKESAVDLDSYKGKRAIASTEKKTKTKKKDHVTEMNIILLKSYTKNTKELIKELEEDPMVEYAEPNYKRELFASPNDSFFGTQWHHNNTGQSSGTIDADIDSTNAWDIEVSADPVTVAVLDSGTLYTHEDLITNMWDGTGCVSEQGLSISNGCPHYGWDFENNDNDPLPQGSLEDGSQAHGTWVAGTTAARANNSTGVSGMSYDNNIRIMALRFGLDTVSEAKAINFAKNNGVKIINASYGGDGYTQTERDAIAAFPGIFVAAAANGGTDGIGDDNDAVPIYPCSYNLPNIICIAATDRNDDITSFSNYGTIAVDLGAPGASITTTGNASNSAYFTVYGTSFSSPIVAGTAALLWSQNNELTSTNIRNLILDNVDTLPSLTGLVATGGRLNINSSLTDLISTYSTKIATIRSDRFPANDLAPHTTSTTISLTTNENATCRYATLRNTTYDAMPGTFTSTGSTTHTKTITGLKNGLSYNYYVRCTNGSNVKNTSDYAISFSVGTVTLTPIYRLYNTKTGVHLYTRGVDDRDKVLNTWYEFVYTDGGPAFYASLSPQPGLTPIYRLYNTKSGAQLYTRGEADREKILTIYPDFEYTDDAAAFYASLTDDGNTPIYRLYNTKTGVHLYTRGDADRDKILLQYPEFEYTDGAAAFYAQT